MSKYKMDIKEMDCEHVNNIKLSRILCLWWWIFHFHSTRDFLKHLNKYQPLKG